MRLTAKTIINLQCFSRFHFVTLFVSTRPNVKLIAGIISVTKPFLHAGCL